MPQLRQDRFTKEWVFLATECAKHPKDLVVRRMQRRLPAHDPNCPLCPGNEDRTPPEVLRLPVSGHSGWQVRVVSSHFTGMSFALDLGRMGEHPACTSEGFGIHEIIVETPDHSLTTALLPDAHVATILRASKARFDALSLDSGIAHATIFKNHMVEAGTAVEHSHCQLITAPVISSQVANRLQAAFGHYHQFGQCIFCTVLREELDDQTRIVMATEHFVALEPFASATPFCTHIYPLRHMANFGEIRGDEINDLARILRSVLAKLYFGLENPDFSYIIRTTPVGKAEIQYYHWYLSISPRLSGAGFDLGSGTLINTVLPEQAAEFLREVRVEQAIPA